ncbi:hypothetical protein EVB91_190 [Rhizobium phage RHph_I1_18]|nr:hypothetical protein EVB91_190 [Rhizobium phage RHph_I1_18]
MDRFLSRKFLLALVIVLAATGLVYVKSIGDTSYTTIIGTVIAAYIAGNVVQKATVK